MADDRMNNQDQEKNLGGKTGQEGGQFGGGHSAPGRNPQDDKSTGQRGRNEDDDLGSDQGRSGGQNMGSGQNKGQGNSGR